MYYFPTDLFNPALALYSTTQQYYDPVTLNMHMSLYCNS